MATSMRARDRVPAVPPVATAVRSVRGLDVNPNQSVTAAILLRSQPVVWCRFDHLALRSSLGLCLVSDVTMACFSTGRTGGLLHAA